MINYDLDQQQKAAQIDAAADRYEERWSDGYEDGLWQNWKGCKYPKPDCSRYCPYFHGYALGKEQGERRAKQDRAALGVNEYEF